MAVILQMTYQKKLGLPNFSSHSCSVSLTVEIPDVSTAAQETTKLYALLQAAVDNEIQEVGFMPDATTYGMNNATQPNGHSGNGNGHSARPNGNGYHRPAASNGNGEAWNCTDGQKGLILRVVNENKIPKDDVEGMAQQLFGMGVNHSSNTSRTPGILRAYSWIVAATACSLRTFRKSQSARVKFCFFRDC